MWVQISVEDAEKIAALAKSEEISGLESQIRQRLLLQEKEAASSAEYLITARKIFEEEGELEFDDDAVVSLGADDGAYVMAWRWIPGDLIRGAAPQIGRTRGNRKGTGKK
ncbi:MAG: hypothetical protein ACYCUV_11785 [Phycisphaerae bacterium]|jgi:hypothetical protein